MRRVEEAVSYPEGAVIARLFNPDYSGILLDGLVLPEVREAFLQNVATGARQATVHDGSMEGLASSAFARLRGDGMLASRKSSAEQSNSSMFFGDRLMMKLFRRLQAGENPDAEIGRFLTEVAHYEHIAPFAGELVYTPADGDGTSKVPTTIGLLQGLVQNNGDGWYWTLDQIKQGSATYDQAARLLGRRTAEMHLALATPTDNPAFAAEPATPVALAADADRLEAQIAAALQAVRSRMNVLPEDLLTPAAMLIAHRNELHAVASQLRSLPSEAAGQRTRIHGDYHLGQVLRTESDFVLLDFEGEPARSLEERRAKQSPLRDVAGMVRSFSYAGVAGYGIAASQAAQRRMWERSASDAFLAGYRDAFPEDSQQTGTPAVSEQLLRAFLLEKSLYELMYELNNRPDWISIPLQGILELLEQGER